jgi:hypothetical protein
MKKTTIISFLLFLYLLSVGAGLTGHLTCRTKPLKYNFTSLFRMDMEGSAFLFFDYKFFFETSASVNFFAQKDSNGRYAFKYNGIERTGYLLSTGGRKGSSLYFFTADYDLKRAQAFREKNIVAFRSDHPYYDKRLKKIRRRPMEILSSDPNDITFSRDSSGIHSEPMVKLRVSDSHSFTFSFIYEIMGKLLKSYCFSYLPEDGLEGIKYNFKINPSHSWLSEPLDFSTVLEETAKLSSEDAKKRARFRQSIPFTLKFHVAFMDNDFIVIQGERDPNVKAWKKMKIRHVKRVIKIRLADNVVMADDFALRFINDKGKGGTVRLSLRLKE